MTKKKKKTKQKQVSSGCIISAPSFEEEVNYAAFNVTIHEEAFAPKTSTTHNNMSSNRQRIWCTECG